MIASANDRGVKPALMRFRHFATLAIALGTVGGLTTGTVSAAATSSGGVSAGPLHWDPSNPATRSYYISTVSPGGTFSDQMRVQNPNDDSVDLIVSGVDGITAIPSGAVYANRTDPVSKWGAWVTPDVSSLTLGAHQEALVGFTVHVPADATPGDHLAGVAFENAHPTPGSGPISISNVVRTVVGVLVKVPGPAAFHMTIFGVSIQPLSNQNLSSVVVTLEDEGRLLGHPVLVVTVTGPHGYEKTVSRQLDTVLPADTIPYPFPWPDNLAAGDYTISVVGSAPEMHGTVTFSAKVHLGAPLAAAPRAGSTVITPQSNPGGGVALPGWVVPLVLALSLALVFLLSGAILLLGRHLRRGKQGAAERPKERTAR
jgi:hypothetical protein